MARSPFQGGYQPGIRPTVVTSPDALVYINGESDILGCPKCRRKFDWNKFITSIQVDLNIDSPPGSASISLTVPRHSVDDFYFEGNPLITPMMEIEIFAKGYFLLEGIPQYYPIFWGLVTEVSNNYSGGEHTVTISCADILKWWELCKMNINPAFTGPTGQQGRSIFGNVFFGTNPYDVIWTLAQQAFGDVVVGTGSLNTIQNEKNAGLKSVFRSALGDIMQYWNQRFTKIRSNLLLYGTAGTAVRGDVIQSSYANKKPSQAQPFASQLVRQANGNATAQMDFDPTDPAVVAFRTQGTQAGQVNFWQTEYQTKLELANAAKEAIGFEFYMDVTGDIVFKPPFYNLDILSNKPVSWIQDIDVIDWDFSESEAEVITQIQIQGNYTGNIDWGMPEEATPLTSVTDYHLLRKYGWRSQTLNSEFMSSPQLMFYVGLDMLDRYNSKRHRGTVSIPFRPELRLGFPVYIAPLDQIWYVQGISHNIAYGGRAQTTLTLTAKRGKFIAPQGIGTLSLTGYKGPKGTDAESLSLSVANAAKLTARQLAEGGRFKADVGDAAQIPAINAPDTPGGVDPYAPLLLRHPKTGRLVGYPNVVMAYTRPFSATPDELNKVSGRAKKPRLGAQDKATAQAKQQAAQKELDAQAQASQTVNEGDALREKHLTNRYSYGINSAGVYTYLHDTSKVVLEMLLLPAANITFNQDVIKFAGQSGMIRPVSDERGFEVIGHHRYGRGVSLRDGSLVLSKGLNEGVNIGTQLALAGGLYETLQAQSHGLTTGTDHYDNPADAVVRLSPEDLQTAGVINPDTKKPEFIDTAPNFISTAPLNSQARQGANSPPNVEATQLSRALTLVEMSVRDNLLGGSTIDPNCSCLAGRSDLAFINVGYQVQIFESQKSATGTEDLVSQSRALVSQAREDALADPRFISGEITEQEALNYYVGVALKDTSIDLQDTTYSILGGADDESLRGDPSSDLVAPVEGPVLQGVDVLNKVDTFLANLYRTLDEPHQQYEKELRGELIQVATRTPNQVRFETDLESEPKPFAPPFSVPSRAAGGDPKALALEANTPLNRISDAWSAFGNDLKASSNRSKLVSAINQSTNAVVRLEAEKKELETALRTGGVVLRPGSASAQVRLDDIDLEIANERQAIANNQLKLQQLNQESST